MRINKELEIIWQKELISESWGDYKKISISPNGNIYLGGNTKKGGGQNIGDVWITALDKNGNELWRKFFGGKLWEELNDLKALPDGSLLF
jgi:hypothetical protein